MYMLNLNNFLLFSETPEKLVDFYKKVLQKDVEWSDGGFQGFLAGSGGIVIGSHDKVHGKNPNPERLIFNFETENVQKDFDRIKGLGVKVIAEPYHPMEDSKGKIATFEDPDGNYFQLMSPMK
jgi:predicted enzyme related to lactoylglutathione lyase